MKDSLRNVETVRKNSHCFCPHLEIELKQTSIKFYFYIMSIHSTSILQSFTL